MDHAEQCDIAAGKLINLELIRRFIVVVEKSASPGLPPVCMWPRPE
jgi:hypothetical protein